MGPTNKIEKKIKRASGESEEIRTTGSDRIGRSNDLVVGEAVCVCVCGDGGRWWILVVGNPSIRGSVVFRVRIE
jgi:hypothetical protein